VQFHQKLAERVGKIDAPLGSALAAEDVRVGFYGFKTRWAQVRLGLTQMFHVFASRESMIGRLDGEYLVYSSVLKAVACTSQLID
jgi:hypothetical protein